MGAKKDVLIIDDEKNIIQVLKDYCERMGCFDKIIVANEGSLAANKLVNQKFDLILLDLTLPKKSGVDIVKEIADSKQSLNQIKDIVIISGTLEKEKLTKLISMGIKHFVTKPFDEATFQEKILKVLATNSPS